MRTAVIGAGAAGLVSARELLDAGHHVDLIEARTEIGGLWCYGDTTSPGFGGGQEIRPLYESLRTNLPADLMGFRSFPFRHPQTFPGHRDVRAYLEAFAEHFELRDHLEAATRVESVRRSTTGWAVTTTRGCIAEVRDYEAVAVCNGHYASPWAPPIPGLEGFPGTVLHSHLYREPEPFAGQRLLLVGSGASAADLAIELASVCEHVDVCSRWKQVPGQLPIPTDLPTLTPRPVLDELLPDGRARCSDGTLLEPFDTVLLCTGYQYSFPFLDTEELGLRIDRRSVEPLYLDIVPADHPTLAFVGLPYLVVPFPLFEIQARWFARALVGRIEVPGVADRHAWVADQRRLAVDEGRDPDRRLCYAERQASIYDDLASRADSPPLPGGFEARYKATHEARMAHPLDYRDRPLQPDR